MQKKDKLFELIDSMSMSEKRYFKVFASRHTIGKQNNYISLFNEVEKMGVYDPDELQNRLEKQEVPTKYLSSDKNYLYNLVLKSLSAFHSGKSIGLHIKESLHQAEVLFERGLYTHCLKILKKVGDQALGHNQISILPEIEKLKFQASSLENDKKGEKKSLENTFTIIELLQNEQGYRALLNQVETHERTKMKSVSDEFEKSVKEVLTHPLLQQESLALTFQSKLYFWEIKGLISNLLGDPKNSLAAYTNALHLILNQKNHLTEYPLEFAAVKFKILLLKDILPDERYQDLLFEFRSIPDKLSKVHPHVKANIYINSYFAEMSRLIKTSRFTEAFDLLPAMESMYTTFEEEMNPEMKLAYKYVFIFTYLTNHQPTRALIYINIVLNNMGELSYSRYYLGVLLFNLIAHHGLENYKHLKYISDSTSRYLKRGKISSPGEALFTRTMGKIALKPDLLDKDEALKTFVSGLLKTGNDADKKRSFPDLDLTYWMQGILSGDLASASTSYS